ncbi:uncharacterized protein LOC111265842 isoform X1 [Varroa jacobsoni]|uniref:uncharacterized protein LOC111265842 isoform X1 n=1 Tax=Varroa jacobsoni TaxID=62625 RepID=UPI000BF8B3F5|nr:uncharacterized protein LOC111265842 isoform X1 [Varroa jacobsoni]
MLRAALNSPEIVRLGNVAVLTAVGSCIGLLYMQERTRKKFKQSEYFQKTMRVLLENQSARTLLGEPVIFGNVNLYDPNLFYVTAEKAKLVIPVRGSKRKGVVYSWCVRHVAPMVSTRNNSDMETNCTDSLLISCSYDIRQQPHFSLDLQSHRFFSAVANTAPLLPNEKTSVDSEAGAVTQLEESSEKKLSQWRVMRVEILLEQAKDKRLLVYKTPEGDENFVDTFDDFKLCTRDSKVLRG